LDVSDIAGEVFDLTALCQIVRRHGLLPVAIQGGSSSTNQRAQLLGLAVLNASSHQDKAVIQTAQKSEIKTKIITTPVRSGQQVVSMGADLIVTSTVSRGAELLSEGHIHVYGTLRGKALAGIGGFRGARIFCQALDAELVAIAGIYQLREGFPAQSGACQIYIHDDRIKIEPL